MLSLATAHTAHLRTKAYKRGWGFEPSSLLIRRVYHSKYRLMAQNKQALSFLILMRNI